MTNTYITPQEYLRGNSGQETASLVGNALRLSAPVVVGATSLPVSPNTTVSVAVDDRAVIFDGSSTEIVLVTVAAAAGASAISVSATAFAHAKYTSVCTDGVLGSLADEIITASDMVEDTCLQSLLLGSRTDVLPLKTMRASISNERVLFLRPENFPVQSVTSLTLTTPGASIPLDPAQAFLDAGQQVVKFFQLIPTGSTPLGNPYQTQLNQRTVGTITLSYTSGFAYASLPPKVKKACVLFCSDLLSKRRNSMGATDVQLGHVRFKMGHIGDTSGDSDLVKQARGLLSSFIQENF